MFELSEVYLKYGTIVNCNYFRHTPQTTFSANRKQLHDVNPREDSALSLKDTCLEREVDVIRVDDR